MHVHLLIGPSERAAARLRAVLSDQAGALGRAGIVAPDWNPVRLYLACSDPDRAGVVRFARGYRTRGAQARLLAELEAQIDALGATGAGTLVIASGHLGRLMPGAEELARLRTLLGRVATGFSVTAHVEAQARHLARTYPERVAEGRIAPLSREIALARSGAPWWQAALAAAPQGRPYLGLFPTLEAPPHWLDYAALLAAWEGTFGAGSVTLRPLERDRLAGPEAARVLAEALGLSVRLGVMPGAPVRAVPNGPTTARLRAFNALLLRYAAQAGIHVPRELRRRFAGEMATAGAPLDPGALSAVSERFRDDNARLAARFPGLGPALEPPPPAPDWTEPDPAFGFRATQYLAAFLPALETHGVPVARLKETDRAEDAALAALAAPGADALLSPGARAILPPLARMNVARLQRSAYAPHDRLGTVDETAAAPAYPVAPPRVLPEGSTGRVIVACMKNEAPYILEWVAYHRAIGVDGFLIYTNGCEDGTAEILDRLDAMGIVHHRPNDDWTGKSPQQHALNRAPKEDVVRRADWLIHIDVDEFINVRCGDGTLDALLDRVPGATNIAMTWRLFGHNGITRLDDRFVIEQFDTCAPKYCPKPHTVWGYKTMFRNIGAYAKLSCHRPNKLAPGAEERVRWVNGSGADMTGEAIRRGWRSSRASIGYDLVQLNHYALRSAESFLVKRQRGRALHVDRTIGLNYWIRMDWSDVRDITIQRNLPRLRAEHDRLLADDALRHLHDAGLDWHRAKARTLQATPEFADLYRQAVEIRLTGTERVAYALALDTES
ncbi:glycosyltransferase family 2 protein [Roseivivax isoporae]|uniref:Glycosyl transferase family 2 n=1 Tax=Roseivivax isoporae LMG 25204 TaxID=1449351 RepID=X7F5V2_9RHOB|nr:glycosyltransferase family 2 protein [Roseivivax isoporae]ETX28307.1 glycosyl transferase family 2 [Roseivivax isoporae LMG 25204]